MANRRLNYHWLWKFPLGCLEIFWALLTTYIAIALFGLSVPIGGNYIPKQKGIKMYLRTDGIHTDFIVPVRSEMKDWTKTILWKDLRGTDTSYNYIAFGWGDQGFFLNTPEWSDLKFSTAFDALFYRGKSAVHAVYQPEPEEGLTCERLFISETQYQKLINYIENSFQKDSLGMPVCIKDRGYWDYDAFYQAKGKYSLFSTCNSWINTGLKESELPACLWTPFAFGILSKYE